MLKIKTIGLLMMSFYPLIVGLSPSATKRYQISLFSKVFVSNVTAASVFASTFCLLVGWLVGYKNLAGCFKQSSYKISYSKC